LRTLFALFAVKRFHSAYAIIFLSLSLAACGPSKPSPIYRYALTGKIVSIDRPGLSLQINGDAVPGLMAAMSMDYKVKKSTDLDPLSPGDAITADIVIQDEESWLENIRPAQPAAAPTPAAAPAATPAPNKTPAKPSAK
jgi:Cu/Ag efflux protein CusF